jgi:alpha-galactosidase
MNPTEYRTHMSLWALLAAPLLAGNDLSKMSPDTLAILTNRDVIAIDQDPAGPQGDRVRAEGPLEIWVKPLAGGARAVGLFNRSDLPAEMAVDFAEVGVSGAVKTRNVWAATDLGAISGYTAIVPAHGVLLLRLGA